MTKKKTSKKQGLSFENMPIVKTKKKSSIRVHRPTTFFKSHANVGKALLECLEDDDAESFLEILEAYLSVNKTKIARESRLSRTTVQNAFSKKGNPTIRTIAKIVHRAVA